MQEFLSVIRSSTLFSGISEQELTAMLACLGTKASRFPKDALLLRAGDTAESIGLVLSGSVLVEQEDVWGNRNILSKAGPGQTFAAAYACAPGPVLKVSVAAETPATVLFLNVKRVLTMCPSACARHSRIIRNLLGELAEKNLRFGEKLTHMGSAPRAQRSCPTFPQRRSGLGPANLTFRFQDSSLRIILASSAAACRWSLDG